MIVELGPSPMLSMNVLFNLPSLYNLTIYGDDNPLSVSKLPPTIIEPSDCKSIVLTVLLNDDPKLS